MIVHCMLQDRSFSHGKGVKRRTEGEGRRKMDGKNELSCILYMYQLPTRSVNNMQREYMLMKNKNNLNECFC